MTIPDFADQRQIVSPNPHPQNADMETSTLDTFVPSSDPSSSSRARADPNSQLSTLRPLSPPLPPPPTVQAKTHPPTDPPTTRQPTTHDDNIHDQIATEPSLGSMRRTLNHGGVRHWIAQAFDKLVGFFKNTTTAGEDDNDNNNVCNEEECSGGCQYHTSNQYENLRDREPVTEGHPNSHNCGTIEHDKQSVCSEDSPNKFQRRVTTKDLDGRKRKVSVQFDTGAGPSFITRGTLNTLGHHQDYPIPTDRVETFTSPINKNAKTRPTQYTLVKMWNQQIDFFDNNVRLRIIEEPDVILIIIGRNIMAKHTKRGITLLSRLEQSNNDSSSEESSADMISPLLKDRRSEEQRHIDLARDQKHQNDTNHAFQERQKILESSATGSSPGPADAPPVRTTFWQRHHSAAPADAESARRTATSQRPNGPPTPIQDQPAIPNNYAGRSDFTTDFESQRSLSASTQSTQSTRLTRFTGFTGFSFRSRESTTSSMSSYSDAASIALKPRGPSSPQGIWPENAPRRM